MAITSEVNKIAWIVRRRAAAKQQCKVTEIVWGVCLQMARKYVALRTQYADSISKTFVNSGALYGAPAKLLEALKDEIAKRLYKDVHIHIKTLHNAASLSGEQWIQQMDATTPETTITKVHKMVHMFKAVANNVSTKSVVFWE